MDRSLKLVLVVTLYGLYSACNGQVIQSGECDDSVEVVPNFQVQNFIGHWYEISRTPNPYQSGDCSFIDFIDNGSPTLDYDVNNVIINDNFFEEYHGTARAAEDGTAKLVLNMQNYDNKDFNYWVLMTDYSHFALVYTCESMFNEEYNETQRYINLWKLGRETSYMNDEAFHAVMNVRIMNTFGIDATESMYMIEHSDEACYVLPIIEEGDPIILPGQCNENITVVEDFDLTAFAGLWHNVASYESDDGEGNCRNNYFTFNEEGGDVSMLNTRIIDEILISRTDSIRILGDNGKFIVTRETGEGPTEREVWVLATDYTSYALTYSCENVGEDQMRIYSQKMSRNRQFTPDAEAAINEVVDSLVILNERYYIYEDQSDDACFYYPEHVEDQPVVFRGQCVMDIRGVPDFDFERFAGLWHEIEGYPSLKQQGTCNNVAYTSDGNNTLEFHITQVIDEQLQEATGLANLITTDDSGVFLAELDANAFHTWVLATDYDSYALIYACVNLNPDVRGVWSWKVSRTKSMTAAGNAAINAVIATIPVLDDRYYQNKDQSREACFFYPTPVDGKPVVFPGQCDETIPVMSDFDHESFQGVWNEIESYPKTQQPGECISYNFVSELDHIQVNSREIRDQLLNTATGSLTSTDDSAKFTATIRIDDVDITLPYWILATDYTDYALAYSCINIDDDWRGIWSFKLSRTRSLSPAAISAIDAVTADIVVLGNEYFENTAQTDHACFYFPDLEPGEPVIIVGQCDLEIPVVQNFNVNDYTGLWHLISSYPSDFRHGTCNDVRYTFGDTDEVEVYGTHVIDESLNTNTGIAVQATTNEDAKFIVSYPGREDKEFWILDTDYESYSMVYSCENVTPESRRVWSWILSRSRELSHEADASINEVIDSINVLNDRYYQEVDNSLEGCFYYPEPVTDKPVVFRGQCDLNIPVVADFDIERYMGLWHEIESYPSNFQGGTCNNAYYTFTYNGSVEISNTQVIDENLTYINGFAEIDTEDGSAKFIITYPVIGTDEYITLNYWVLSTDYDNYALVYSCENIDENHRRVVSWKFSRTKQLLPASNDAINAVVNTVQVLEQKYFQYRDQSPEGCFFYPEPNPGEPVIFPGQCDESIAVVEDFDLEKFEGIWREIAAYPKIELPGDCITFDYRATSSNTLDLFTNEVINERLHTTSGSVDAPEGSARMTITFNIFNNDITIPFWILATDYENYALAYSCRNIDSDWRGVWSWMFSRTRELTNEANTAINNAMALVQVLEPQYYEENNHTADACFYLPELGPNDPVTFPGQCDETIPVVEDFDSNRFSGLWHEIESYYQEFQEGECQDTTFKLTEDGSFEVVNSQVIDETLDTIRGSAVAQSAEGGKLDVTLTRDSTSETVTLSYWILSTDYESYALIYSCSNLNPERRRVKSYILSRSRELSSEARDIINEIIDGIPVLNNNYYNPRQQSNEACFYYPELIPGNPVTFRGQCDEEISVVQNFDIDRYIGIWYDVQSYPQVFQDGTCPQVTYSLIDDETIEIVNTQVLRQELDTVSGIARVASDDGSGKLIVSFPAFYYEVTEFDYWVLATDYENYALVYSCRNIAPDRRSVSSWKLSREPILSNASDAAINAVMNTVQVLHEDYYQDRGHNEEDCFFYPDNDGGPVILDGQCDPISEVPVVDNFNEAAFNGIWHEIARFPSELQTGECANAEITLSDSAGDLSATIIYGERINSVIGQVVTGGDRGVLTATFPNGSGGSSVFNFYILDTDYDEFALLYGCRNIDEDSKQVYSWKLSRTQDGLSQDANDRIDAVVNDKVDLFHGYFEYTDQSLSSCFYYPVFDNPPSIILPGLCNHSITGLEVFNLEAYQGRWFEIARYPATFHQGDCSRSYHSPRATVDGLQLDTLFTSVSEERLASVEGILRNVPEHSADGSLLSIVNFMEDNVNHQYAADYFVMATDYDNFALVYSCINLPNTGNRQVLSYILSRERTLDNQYYDLINPVIESTQGLLEEYYINADQSEETCFYIPEVNGNEDVLFRGQCDENIRGVDNFDFNRYAGWWHEIEHFPTAGNSGVCISSRYEINNGQNSFVTTNVFGLQGTLTTGTVVVSGDAPGRLRKILSDGTTMDIWVLATDYETYSLLYSCENFNDEYRRDLVSVINSHYQHSKKPCVVSSVWSAKHSKQRALTSAAQAAMQPIIDNNRVLYKELYRPVDQSVSACFHYPAQTGQYVVLPGQCDYNIPIKQEFDTVSYAGTWYLIERYPHVLDITGNCPGVRYTQQRGSEIIDVTHWQVVDDEVDRLVGTAVAASNGSAILEVTLPVAGTNLTQTTNIYILDTDYASYSLVYTCRNLNQFERYVGAWKLSRTRSLPGAATTAINNIMAQREELHQPYFVATTQNEDCPDVSFILKSTLFILIVSLIVQYIL